MIALTNANIMLTFSIMFFISQYNYTLELVEKFMVQHLRNYTYTLL